MSAEDKVSLASLELVDCPVSIADAVQFPDVFDTENHLRASDFYVIAGRPAARFEAFSASDDGLTISVVIRVGTVTGTGTIDVGVLPEMEEFEGRLVIQMGADAVVVLSATAEPGQEAQLLTVYSPDSFLYWASRGRRGLTRPENYQELSTFDLLYAGIAKVSDSYSRLIEGGHKQRMEILGAELQREQGARVADETYLFFFRVQPIVMRTFGAETDFDKVEFNVELELKRWVADAEKAMVSLLQPKYNRTLYQNYPDGSDGLVNQGFKRYGYWIAEDIAFKTTRGTIRGARQAESPFSNGADFIFVEGEDVSLKISGVDFDGSDPT